MLHVSAMLTTFKAWNAWYLKLKVHIYTYFILSFKYHVFYAWLWSVVTEIFKLDFCLTVHHQLGKVIKKNQLDAKIIYWSIRPAQHVSGNLLPIIRSVRLRFLQHMVTCCCGRPGFGERQRGTTCTVWSKLQSGSCSWRWAKIARNMLTWS